MSWGHTSAKNTSISAEVNLTIRVVLLTEKTEEGLTKE